MKILSVSILVLYILGSSYLYNEKLEKTLPVYNNSPIKANIELSSSKIEVNKEVTNPQSIHTVDLMTKVTNNTQEDLTDVRLVLETDIGTLETPTTKRYTHLPKKENGTVFALPNIHPNETTQAVIKLYSVAKKEYPIKVWIYTEEQYTTTTNTIMLTAE